MPNETRASYTDTFRHAFDAKGRITVPSEWRAESYESRLFVLPAESCVRVYPESWMSDLQGTIKGLKDADPLRHRVEALATIAQGATWDQQGRIMVKETLRKDAGLAREAVLVGKLSYFEIWDKAAWETRQPVKLTVEEALKAIGL